MGNTRRKKIVMKIAIILLILGCTSCQRANRPPPTTTTTTYDDDYYDDDDSYDDDDEIVSLVKSYIDAGTCDMVSTGSTCGDNATSYYYEFEYEDQRVVIVNGIPDHDAENDQLVDNTNTRCERWQFMTVPIDPSKGTDATETSMGVIALAVTGGTFYNDLSNDDGAIALYNEGQSLDSCAGHSSDNSQYHYHANILCEMTLLMPVFASRLDGQRMGFQFMDIVMILKETSLPHATLSLMVTLNMRLKFLLGLSKLLLMRLTMSMWILMTAIWIRQMAQFTQQQDNIHIL